MESSAAVTVQASPANTTPSSAARRHIVVVGAGPVGVRFVQELLARDDQCRIRLFGDEPYTPYDRIKLSALLAGDVRFNSLDQSDCTLTQPGRVEYVSVRISKIHRQAHQVEDEAGNRYPFDTLVLATGSRAHKPDIPGIELKGVYTFRALRDAEALKARLMRTRHVVVVGGGLLGLETAKGLTAANTQVTLVHQGQWLMNQQLDEYAGRRLEADVAALGIDVRLGSGAGEIIGEGVVSGVRLRNGEQIACDTVVVATGIRANLELARAAWVPVGRGVRVNTAMRTEDDSIYAIGECAECDGRMFGLVAPGFEQAAVAADQIAGGEALYQGYASLTRLKVIQRDVFSIGVVGEDEPGTSTLTFTDEAAGHYRKLVLDANGAVCGALGFGQWQETYRLQELIVAKRRLGFLQRRRFQRQGLLWPDSDMGDVRNWPDTAQVCNCNAVSKGDIAAAMQAGCQTMALVQQRTRAGTVCGSCTPLLAELVQSPEPLPAAKGQRWVTMASLIALVASVLYFLLQPIPASTSVLDPMRWDLIWTDSLYKQISGYTLLGLSCIALIMSLRKRISWMSRWGDFSGWRIMHVLLGVLALVTLLAHTGLSLGENLNRWLMLDFLLLALLGGLTGLVMAIQRKLSARKGQRLREAWTWAHTLAFWPLPVLLGFHILSVYYF